MARYWLVPVLLLLSTAWLQAQTAGNVYAGYSFVSNDLHIDVIAGQANSYIGRGRANLNGWNFSGEMKLFHGIGAVADFNGSYGSAPVDAGKLNPATSINTSFYSFLFGPRVSVQVGKIRPFAEALVGVASQSLNLGSTDSKSDSNLATAFGGGIDYRLLRSFAWRVQADYIGTRLFKNFQQLLNGSTPVQRNVRISTGLVFRF